MSCKLLVLALWHAAADADVAADDATCCCFRCHCNSSLLHTDSGIRASHRVAHNTVPCSTCLVQGPCTRRVNGMCKACTWHDFVVAVTRNYDPLYAVRVCTVRSRGHNKQSKTRISSKYAMFHCPPNPVKQPQPANKCFIPTGLMGTQAGSSVKP